MNQATVEHPDAAQLAAFVSGRLNDADSLEIENHLADCQICATVLEKLPEDSLGALLQPSGTIADVKNATPWENVATQTPIPGTGVVAVVCQTPFELADHPRYRVLEPLGVGGMGTVFKAEHRHMERVVALKVINPKLIDSPAAVDRFQREVKLAGRLAHPNIVTAHDADQAGGLHFLVMEFVDGKSLAQVVAEQRPLPVAQACDYVRQAALGLQHACDRHMVHRDIKPHNLMLTPEGKVKILDFGLARFVLGSASPATDSNAASESSPGGESVDMRVTASGQIMGSVDFMAPEQGRDPHQADIRSDIYSLGCTLYFLLAGHSPFAGSSIAEKLAAHGEQTAKPLTEIRSDLPAALGSIVEKMMAKDPAQRYQTPAEIAEALAPFANAKPQVRSRRRIFAVAASLLIIALGLGGYQYGPAVYRFATNQGELVIEVADKHVEVVVKENGNIVQIIDTKATKALTLKAGKYEIDLTPGQKEKGLALETDRIILTRGGRQIVKAYFNPEGLKAEAAAELNRKIALQEKKVQRQRAQADYAMTQFKRMEELGRVKAVVPALVEEYRQKLALEEATLAEMATELQQLRERVRKLDTEFPLKEKTEVDQKIALLEKSLLRQRLHIDYLTIAFKRQMQRDEPQQALVEAKKKLAVEEATLAEMATELDQLRERARKLDKEPGGSTLVTPWRDSDCWVVKGRELHQIDNHNLAGHLVLFGDLKWTDYDFEAEAKITGGRSEIGLTFRATESWNIDAVFGCFDNSQHRIMSWINSHLFPSGRRIEVNPGSYTVLGSIPGQMEKNCWYRMRLEARATIFKLLLDGKTIISTESGLCPRGCIGLFTTGTSARFRNIKVSDPSGRVLFEGVQGLGVQGILPKQNEGKGNG
jgi:tRNA A-37 threonylcarbamoyl transferase component Bud32